GGGSLLQEYQLATLINPGAPGGSAPADHVIDLSFDTAGSGIWEINGIVYTPPTLPTLLTIINGGTTASDFNVSEHTFILVQNEVVELRIHGAQHGITHPFHLHGHAFDIVQSAAGPVNYVNPPRRDVIGVEAGGVVIRFRADNPGPWFLHCHIDWHLEAGLAVVFAEAPAEEREGPQSEIVTPQWLDLCPAYYALPEDEQ
ncbi:Cupredoxin, partial [Mycena rosella]